MSIMQGIGAGLGVAGSVAGLLRRPHHVNWNQLRAWLGGLRADSYLSPADLAAGEATKSRLMTTAEDTGVGLRTEALRRARQRNVDSAPAVEATLGRVGQTTARLRQNAGDTSEEQLYNVGLGNKRFEQEKLLGLARARVGDELAGAGRDRAAQSTFFNSLLDYTPTALDNIDTILANRHPNTQASAMRFNHATGRLERADDMQDFGSDTQYDSGSDSQYP